MQIRHGSRFLDVGKTIKTRSLVVRLRGWLFLPHCFQPSLRLRSHLIPSHELPSKLFPSCGVSATKRCIKHKSACANSLTKGCPHCVVRDDVGRRTWKLRLVARGRHGNANERDTLQPKEDIRWCPFGTFHSLRVHAYVRWSRYT